MLSLEEKIIAITGIGSPDHPKGNGRAIAELYCCARWSHRRLRHPRERGPEDDKSHLKRGRAIQSDRW